MKKKIALAALSFVSAAVLTACTAPSGSSNAAGNKIGDTIKIGYNLELSGDVAAYGQAEKKGADLAVAEINKSGGIGGKKLKVVSKDNKSDNGEVSTISTNLATQSKVNAILGPATSGATAAASPNANDAAVPLVTPSGTQDSLTYSKGKVQEYIYRTTFQDSFQGKIIAKYATDTLKAKKVALYYDKSSDYAQGIADSFKKAYKGKITVEDTFQAKDQDFQAALTKFKNKDFDAIVMPGYYTETGLITKQARDMGLNQPILGPDGFNDAKYIEGAGAANTNNVYYVSGYSTKVSLTKKADKFLKDYKAKYGDEPNMFAALAYDSVYMIADSAKGAKTSKDIAGNLAKLKNFEGVTGKMTIDKKHNPVKSAVMVGLKDGKEATATAVEAK
ncbi:ABC transporter substrate-binding protein [Streptococcus macacae]|uniref:Receptor family ligand-binding region n=1 Tax=Streptococcus macacae NCTC 11558 TaxID=764298 RepID=G5JYD3_9STRE|nr:ABC transporter substrate-binding protein [Streptococcus macacae]EHJ52210.1 receptor family ligand-binding region [Streptococcus macacae NCTC 11558]SUN78046.1 branched-chain amino acid ABC transporter substrate-binding protein [Streptococcus macacae NCTC 11558]